MKTVTTSEGQKSYSYNEEQALILVDIRRRVKRGMRFQYITVREYLINLKNGQSFYENGKYTGYVLKNDFLN